MIHSIHLHTCHVIIVFKIRMKNLKSQQHLQKASLSTQLSTAQVEDGNKQ